jgi:hypothetical protein
MGTLLHSRAGVGVETMVLMPTMGLIIDQHLGKRIEDRQYIVLEFRRSRDGDVREMM